ncbi:MAG: parallel beta-helix repeat protein [Patiriisocius sp.]|jgi:parallel beta-helix repeat protein
MNRLLIIGMALLLNACSNESKAPVATVDMQKQLLEQLIMAQPGDVIDIPAGTHKINRSLSLKVNGVTLRGAGMDKSILSFKDQTQGAEGLIITGDDILLEGFAVEDAKGDAIKINECRNLVIRKVRVEWTNGPDKGNGAYGLYPVQCENVLIDGSVAIGASDAGIYVGQSNQVIVKNSRAEFNVAGIEIENTTNADVFDNVATNNTGGILVFNMPNLPQPGAKTRVFNNQILNNNTANFAPEGTAVAGVPAGSGVVINSNDEVEVFANIIKDNATANIIISSYFSSGYSDRAVSELFDPYPEAIFIYDNQFSGGGDAPGTVQLQALRVAKYGLTGSFPDILWDGYVNTESLVDGKLPPGREICVSNGEVKVLNVDMANEYANVTDESAQFDCELPKLAAISLQLK